MNVSVCLSPIHDARGAVVGVAAVARDITARKRAEARQREIDERTQLAQRLQSLGQLAGGVAHDFNNLLAIIGNYTIFAIEQTTHDPAVQADLAPVKTAAERAGGLTRQLLLFIRGESARPELVDVNAAIAEAHALPARTTLHRTRPADPDPRTAHPLARQGVGGSALSRADPVADTDTDAACTAVGPSLSIGGRNGR